jgi:hypothetical protein
MQVTLFTEKQKRFVIPTAVGLLLTPTVSSRVINKRLEAAGLQISKRYHHKKIYWILTEAGKQYGKMTDARKQHTDGSPVLQIVWDVKVIELI